MKTYFLILGIGLLTLYQVEAQGHGPIYGLQTPTLAKGGINMSAAGISIATEDDASYMLRYTFFYGITEDLQVTLTTPTVIERLENAPRTRGNSMMPSNGDIEAALWYRFFFKCFWGRKEV
jgi:hypothetical protein